MLAGLRPCVGVGFQDLFHPPRRGAFHLSLTVLVRYRSCRVFSLGRWSPQLPAAFHVGGGTQVRTGSDRPFADGAVTLSGGPFQGALARPIVCNSLGVGCPPASVLQPPCRNGSRLDTARV